MFTDAIIRVSKELKKMQRATLERLEERVQQKVIDIAQLDAKLKQMREAKTMLISARKRYDAGIATLLSEREGLRDALALELRFKEQFDVDGTTILYKMTCHGALDADTGLLLVKLRAATLEEKDEEQFDAEGELVFGTVGKTAGTIAGAIGSGFVPSEAPDAGYLARWYKNQFATGYQPPMFTFGTIPMYKDSHFDQGAALDDAHFTQDMIGRIQLQGGELRELPDRGPGFYSFHPTTGQGLDIWQTGMYSYVFVSKRNDGRHNDALDYRRSHLLRPADGGTLPRLRPGARGWAYKQQ